jgi:pilus assembly protein Flp/PilA
VISIVRTLRRRIDVATNDRGASAVEYGLLVAAIAATLVAVVFGLGGFVKDTFDQTCDALSKTSPTCATSTSTTTAPPAGNL